MADFKLNGVTFASESGGVVSLSNANVFPAGNAIDVKSVVRTDATFSTINATPQTVMTLNYTPKSTSSKILLLMNVVVGQNGDTTHVKIAMFRDSTEIFKGDNEGVRVGHAAYHNSSQTKEQYHYGPTFLDSPNTTSQVSYTVRIGSNGAGTVYLNRSHRDTNSNHFDGRSASSLTLIEFA